MGYASSLLTKGLAALGGECLSKEKGKAIQMELLRTTMSQEVRING